jgi:hypothetical protein
MVVSKNRRAATKTQHTSRADQLTVGHKDDAGKLDLTLIPWDRVALPEFRNLILPLYAWWRAEDDDDFNPRDVCDNMRAEYAARGRDLIADAAASLNHGAAKYAPWNWEKGISRQRLYAAACRHYRAIELGEAIDPDSGLLHYENLAAYPMMIFAATKAP